MSVRRIGIGGAAQPDMGRDKPRRPRLGLMFILSLGVGGAAGLLAFMIIWVPTIYALANGNDPVPQLQANTIFPAAKVVHKTVTVYDPPVYHAPKPGTASSPSPSPSASPSPSSSPRPTPSRSPRPSGSPRPTPTGGD